MGGARILEDTKVTGIKQKNGRVTGVVTTKGEIEAEYVVNCAGMWARELGKLAGVNVPLHAAEHYYLITEPIEGVHRDLPIVEESSAYSYYREEHGGLLLGVFEPVAFSVLPVDKPLFATEAERDAFFDLSHGLEGFMKTFVDYWGGAGAFDALPPERRVYMVETAHKLHCEVTSLSDDRTPPEAFAQIAAPVLVMHGDRSPVVAQRVAARLGEVLQRAEVVGFDGVGHLGPLTHSDLINRRIEQFLWENANA